MPNNIFLTRKCNLKCSYCFASEYFNNIEEEISIENFLKALSFIKRSSSQIGLIGGEPTLYSKFDEIIEILIKDKEIKNIYLYTNGLNIKNYEKLKHSKIKILINCNHPHEIGENKNKRMKLFKKD